MTERNGETLHLQVLGHLGDGPHELFAVLLDLQASTPPLRLGTFSNGEAVFQLKV